MAFVRMVVVPIPAELTPVLSYAARVFVSTDAPLRANAVVHGSLGAQALHGLSVQPLGESVSGFVKVMPVAGDTLRLAVDTEETDDTGLSYTATGDPPIA